MTSANVCPVRRGSRWAAAGLVGVCLGSTPVIASADHLVAEQSEAESGYTAVEELSYETIVDATDGYSATLRVRVALHNSSLSTRDAVHTIALPFSAQLESISAARGGAWTKGKATEQEHERGRRNPGSVYVRSVAPATPFDIPGAQLVVFGIEPGSTIQVELEVEVFPRLRGDHWELDLPARGNELLALAADRRVIVQGLRDGEGFSVDEQDAAGSPFITTRPRDTVTVSWPAHIKSRAVLDGRYEVTPGPPGFDDGRFRLYLRLGPTKPVRPRHVVAVVDRSRSTSQALDRHTQRALASLFDALPPTTSFDALGFNRTTVDLLQGFEGPTRVGDAKARAALNAALADADRGQGTNLVHALEAAAAKTRGKRDALIVVMTDGMFPARTSPRDIARAFEKAVQGQSRPEVLFVIDDPLVMRTGLSPDHPVSRAAAAIGARISLKTLSAIRPDTVLSELLSAPRVLGDLDVRMAKNMVLDDEIPDGLVAGSFVLLRGHYIGKPARRVELRGSLGGTKIRRHLPVTRNERRPDALVATTEGDLDAAVDEGFVLPPWYPESEDAAALRAITQAGRSGKEQRGYLDRRMFRNYLSTRVLPRARVCYNRALRRDVGQSGRVVLEMEVAKGEVMLADTIESKLATDDADLVACMTEAAWALDIPAGKLDDQIYRIRYPLRLVPPEKGRSARVERMADEMLQILLGKPADPPPLPADILTNDE